PTRQHELGGARGLSNQLEKRHRVDHHRGSWLHCRLAVDTAGAVFKGHLVEILPTAGARDAPVQRAFNALRAVLAQTRRHLAEDLAEDRVAVWAAHSHREVFLACGPELL